MNLSLMQALNEDRLEDFIKQQEAAGVGPVSETDFNQLSEKLIKSEKSEDRTLHSAYRDGSNGKQTR